ncbi:SAM-dependent methyltransferase [archaeon]|jgi:ubiquinone/menaquinone biosynthesis C-methylase UbiE|nr:SAM-dependent methyltransferase [archaeon]MDP6548214.1 class I SAM-dependent methyltransferase [Candidatus Woesearchaeota archaeon]HJN57165.1 class I SAM-dependent methyltransferase [Candidatus Woesearchaeota archaeon]|tara:strand:- start:9996 stop:10604 length:609 start_codon:yes stop_codon:yes gene_type:complete
MTTDVEKFIRFCESDFGKKVLEKEVEYVYRELKDYKDILDIGCGIGQFEQKLQDLNITGLDSSAEMLKEARKRSNKTFVRGDGENLDFNDSSFDAVFYVATLEFLADYQKAIQEACRVTKPNGKLLVMMLNPESEYFHEHMQRDDSYFRRIKHTDLREIKNYISGFYEITKEEYFLGIREQQIFDPAEKRFASLYVMVGKKK